MISEIRNPVIAQMLATAGMDFFIVDGEHGTASYETIGSISAVARGAGIACFARIPEIRRETVLKPLDAGVTGIVAPQVETEAQVRELVYHAKYPPVGRRGTALGRAHNLYRTEDAAAYLTRANEQSVLVIQAESPAAVNQLGSLLDLGGIDVVFVGPFDLSVALGIPGRVGDPALQNAVRQVVAACASRGVAAGIYVTDLDQARFWIDEGMRFIVYSGDVHMIVDSAAKAVQALR